MMERKVTLAEWGGGLQNINKNAGPSRGRIVFCGVWPVQSPAFFEPVGACALFRLGSAAAGYGRLTDEKMSGGGT